MLQRSKNSQGARALRTAYLRVCHLELSTGESVSTGGLGGQRWTAREEEEFAEMARYRDDKGGIYERFARSVAPSIYGSEGWMPSPTICDVPKRLFFLRRHQKGCGLSLIRWVEEGPPRWDATSRRHQRFTAG